MNKNSTSHMRKHITIIEDDKALNDGIVLALKKTRSIGFSVTGVEDEELVMNV